MGEEKAKTLCHVLLSPASHLQIQLFGNIMHGAALTTFGLLGPKEYRATHLEHQLQ